MNDSRWRPGASLECLQHRAVLLAQIRAFFRDRDVLEVETPVLSSSGNSDPGLSPFRLGQRPLWLRTSPEYAMKRLLASGSGDIYELGRVFRDHEAGRLHNAEFTMLEWYRVGWTIDALMDEITVLLHACGTSGDLPVRRISYRDLFRQHTDLDPLRATRESLAAAAHAQAGELPQLDRDGLLDLLFSHVVQPQLSGTGLTYVYDYPASQAALARIRNDDPPVAERFELFWDDLELANGYQELTDPREQRRRFEAENERRPARGLEPVILDERFLKAMESGIPECAGVALGVDRLLLMLHGARSLDEVMTFSMRRN
ncbi:MAG: EF-P lysine aminoacylase EpmA [Xanthomonadales bacterium]|nr:EF-P lysine aminoacylase EpmA [Xanthomonadales bacterium]